MMFKEPPALPINPLSPQSFSLPFQGKEAKEVREEKLRKACGDFEALFMARIFKMMRQTVTKSDFLGGGLNQDLFLSLFDEELSRSLAKKGGLGVGRMLYQHLTKGNPVENSDRAPAGASLPGRSVSPIQPGEKQ